MNNKNRMKTIEKELKEVARGPKENLEHLEEFRFWNIVLGLCGLDAI